VLVGHLFDKPVHGLILAAVEIVTEAPPVDTKSLPKISLNCVEVRICRGLMNRELL
jgi:hypothetical protein